MFHLGPLWPRLVAVAIVFLAISVFIPILWAIHWLRERFTYSPMHDMRLNLIGTAILFIGAICWEQLGLPAAILLWVVGLILYVSSNLERRA